MINNDKLIEDGLNNHISLGEKAIVDSNIEFIGAFVKSTIKLDIDAIVAHFAEDATFQMLNFGIEAKGIAEIRQFYEMCKSSIENQSLIQEPKIFVYPDRALIHMNLSFVVTKENPWIPVGSEVDEKCIQVIDIRENKIVRFFDCGIYE